MLLIFKNQLQQFEIITWISGIQGPRSLGVLFALFTRHGLGGPGQVLSHGDDEESEKVPLVMWLPWSSLVIPGPMVTSWLDLSGIIVISGYFWNQNPIFLNLN